MQNEQENEKLINTPYESNIAFLADILQTVRIKSYIYFKTVAVISEDGKYSLKNDMLHPDEFEGILKDAFSAEDYTDYRRLADENSAYISDIRSRAVLSIERGVDIPLERLFERFEFEDFEIHCFILALAVKLDRSFERIYSYLQMDAEAKYLTVDLAVKMYSLEEGVRLSALAYFSGKNKLCDYFFGNVKDNGSLLTMGLNPGTKIVSFALNGFCDETENLSLPCFFAQDAFAEKIMSFYRLIGERTPAMLCLRGERGAGKTLQIRHFCQRYGLKHIVIKAEELETGFADGADTAEDLLRSGVIRCILEHGVLCIDNITDIDGKDCEERINQTVASAVREYRIPAVITSGKAINPQYYSDIQIFEIDLPMPDAGERLRLWQYYLAERGGFEDIDLDLLVSVFDISPGQLVKAVEDAYLTARTDGKQKITHKGITEAVYRQIRQELTGNAVQVNTGYEWDSLIIPEYQKSILDILCGQIKNRTTVYEKWGFGKENACSEGISALFSGPPGTGKTMAAQVVAKRMGLELYRVDLSRVVSKYIGETEKNLEKVFEDALKSRAVLLFDEADALFGKRTAVKDSHDRNANMEVSYLLQKMEEYNGVVIMTTNFSSNFDDAYRRRIKFIVEFPFPDEGLRKKIWVSAFGTKAPVSPDIDYDYLAERFHLSGGSIKNIAVNAAFIAADRMAEIDMGCVIKALRIELGKSGKILSRDDLEKYGFLL